MEKCLLPSHLEGPHASKAAGSAVHSDVGTFQAIGVDIGMGHDWDWARHVQLTAG